MDLAPAPDPGGTSPRSVLTPSHPGSANICSRTASDACWGWHGVCWCGQDPPTVPCHEAAVHPARPRAGCRNLVPRRSDPSRLEMRHFGVKVSIIEPGYFKTAITSAESLENCFLSTWEKVSDETKAGYGENYLKGCKYTTSKLKPRSSLPEAKAHPGAAGCPAALRASGAVHLPLARGSAPAWLLLPPQFWKEPRRCTRGATPTSRWSRTAWSTR